MNKILVPVLALLVGAAGARYYWPRVEYKNVIQEREVIRKDVVTIIREVTRKDGSKETTTEIIDHSNETSDRKQSVTKAASPQWSIGVYSSIGDVVPTYTLTVDRRILGPFSLGVYGQTNLNEQTFGAGLRVEF